MTTASVTTRNAGTDFWTHLRANSETGEIRTTEGRRVAIVTEGFLRALIETVTDKVGGDVRSLLYEAGRRWGAGAFAAFRADVERGEPTLYHPRNMNLGVFKGRFNEMLVRSGWGTFDIYEKYELIFVEMYHSGYAEMVGHDELGSRALWAGFFAGFFTDLIGVEFDCTELAPSVPDESRLVYLLGDVSITNGVRGWLEKGKTYEEILTCLETRDQSASPASKG